MNKQAFSEHDDSPESAMFSWIVSSIREAHEAKRVANEANAKAQSALRKAQLWRTALLKLCPDESSWPQTYACDGGFGFVVGCADADMAARAIKLFDIFNKMIDKELSAAKGSQP